MSRPALQAEQAELRQAPAEVVHQFGRTYRAWTAAFERQVGHPLPRWRILLNLSGAAEGPRSQKQLAETLSMDPGALTRQLKLLEAQGWIARVTDARDNRITLVSLTAAGQQAVAEGLPRRQAFFEATVHNLPPAMLANLSAALALIETSVAAL